jgi:hypothetical protein
MLSSVSPHGNMENAKNIGCLTGSIASNNLVDIKKTGAVPLYVKRQKYL